MITIPAFICLVWFVIHTEGSSFCLVVFQSFSNERELVRSSRVRRQACLAALSSEAGGLPRNRSSDGRK